MPKMLGMFASCFLVSIVGCLPAAALEDCNQIKKLENRLQCLQRNIEALQNSAIRSLQSGEIVLLRSKTGNGSCIVTSQKTVFIASCERAGMEGQWIVDPLSK